MKNFKTQYLDIILSDLPAELAEDLTADLSQWLYWEKMQLEKWNLSLSQTQFLTKIGLPKEGMDCNFEQYNDKDIAVILDNHDLNKSYFPLGFDGCGSIVFLNVADDCVYLCDHDNGNEMLFINSSLEKLAETLIFVAKFFIQKNLANPLENLSKIDEKAVQENTFWYWVLKDK